MSTPVQALTFNLASPIDATQVTIPVRNLKDSRGNSITAMPSGATIIYATIEPRSPANQEIISFTGITNSGSGIVTLTGVTRNLNPQPPYTALTANVPHSNGAECVLSNNPPFYNTFAQTDTNATIGTGVVWTFNTNPQKTGSLTATLPAEYVTKSYADSLAIAGAPDATTIQKGISKMSVAGSTVIGTFTVTIATPAVVTLNSHGLIAGDSFTASTTGALPTGMTPATTYYVIATGLTANNFQFSATYNGTAVNTSGTQSGVHTLTRTSAIAVATEDPRVPTQLENDAMVGQSGNQVGSLNKFEDRFDTTDSINTDQSQLLQNSIQPVGETDATTKSRKIGQSFIPTQSPIDNVQIYKTADTGTFAGTVTVSIQADSAGSPSGTDLVSTVIGNAAWLALATGLNTVSFASPLNVNPNTTYWLVVTTSTNDTSNHPNLGYQNTNAYVNGIFKKNNTTDGWTTIATADLTFSINTNAKNKLTRTDSTGKLPLAIIPTIPVAVDKTKQTFVAGKAITAGNALVYSNGTFSDVTTGNNTTQPNISSANDWWSQSFTVSSPQEGVLVPQIALWDGGAGGTQTLRIVVSIRADSAGQPTGADIGGITSTTDVVIDGNPAIYNLNPFSSPVPVTSGVTYHMVFRCTTSTNYANSYWSRANTAGQGTNTSSNGGANWVASNGKVWCTLRTVITTAGRVYPANATNNDVFANNFIGVAETTVSQGANVDVTTGGRCTSVTGLSGDTQYIGNTDGLIQNSAGANARKIGIAMGATELFIKHDNV